ncbi:hypothetical protein Taro_050675, partial [Colocasia esculenta]|nr:hypothetical protein [Colocasia esculenta]
PRVYVDRVCLLDYVGCPDDRIRIMPSSVTCPIPFSSRRFVSCSAPLVKGRPTGVAHPEKNVHTSGSVSYATHSQKLRHELEHAPTFRELFDRTHMRKGTDDYVSESAHMIAETYDRMMADRYAEGTPQPYLDPEAWVDAVGGSRKGRVYGFGDNLDTSPVSSSYANSVAPPAYGSSSAATPDSRGDDIRTLIREELSQQLPLHLGAMVERLLATIRGAGTSQQAPQVSITFNFI